MKTLKFKNSNGEYESLYKIYENKVEVTEPEYVDLGLPSGSLWANKNIGAKNAQDVGLLFHWAGIEGISYEDLIKDRFGICSWENTPYSEGQGQNTFRANITKYTRTDSLYQLEPEDDAAHVLMGEEWSIPSSAAFQELVKYGSPSIIENYQNSNVAGILFTGTKEKSNNQLFIPFPKDLIEAGISNYWLNGIGTSEVSAQVYTNNFTTSNLEDYRFNVYPIRGIIEYPIPI